MPRYCHVKTMTKAGPKWAMLEWTGIGQDLPNVRLIDSQSAQSQMLASHAPQAVAKLIELGYREIAVLVAET